MSRSGTLTADHVLDVVRGAVVTVLGVDPAAVTPDASLRELGVDSLALVEIADIVEETLGPLAHQPFRIPDGELERLSTVGDTVDAVLPRL